MSGSAPTAPEGPITGAATTSNLSSDIPTQPAPALVATRTVQTDTDALPTSTCSTGSQCQVEPKVFPVVSEELKEQPRNVFKGETITRFDLEGWTEECLRDLGRTADPFSVSDMVRNSRKFFM